MQHPVTYDSTYMVFQHVMPVLALLCNAFSSLYSVQQAVNCFLLIQLQLCLSQLSSFYSDHGRIIIKDCSFGHHFCLESSSGLKLLRNGDRFYRSSKGIVSERVQ